MPLTATQGYKAAVEIEDPTDPGTYVDYSDWLSDGTLSFDQSMLDTTTFGSDGWEESIQGLKSGTFSTKSYNDDTYRTWMWNAVNAEAPIGVKFYPTGNDSGKKYWQLNVTITSAGDGGTVSEVAGGNVSAKLSGKPQLFEVT